MAAQGDRVRPGDAVSPDGPQSVAEALPGLPEELEGVGGGVLSSGPVGISAVLFNEVRLKGGSDFIGCLQRLVNSPVTCGVVNHAASIPATRRHHIAGGPERAGGPSLETRSPWSWTSSWPR
jgi:hypothetical protein